MEAYLLICLLASPLGARSLPTGNIATGSSFVEDNWDHNNVRSDRIGNGRFILKALPNPALMKDSPETDNTTTSSMIDAVKFMRKFGYVPKGDEKADFIFSAETLTEKLKLVQKFGAIPQTGELDEATVKLISTPRCGVHDVDSEEGKRRRKRFILGSSGWNKRIITYTIGNWSPKLTSKENVQRELSKAFLAWGKYSHLQFQEVSSNDADIVIFFAEYNHYDNYPFDGEGGILAHAYYPYEFGSYGGDIHFDESERWALEPEDEHSGLDFFTVAVHEIGHSLGLAHSAVSSSIMFPYYKGIELNFVLDYDDIMGLWELYIRRRLDGDDEYFNRTTTTTTTTTTVTPSYDSTQNDGFDTSKGTGNNGERNGKETNDTTDDYNYNNDDDVRYHGDYETVDEHEERQKVDVDADLPKLPPLFPEDTEEDERTRQEEEFERRRREEERRRKKEEEDDRRRWEEERRREEEEIRRREEEERRKWEEEEERRRTNLEPTTSPTTTPIPIPDLCNGNFDSVASIRDEIFIFKGKYMWRYHRKGVLLPGYPSAIHNMFSDLPRYIKKIDAVYERRNDSRIVFFIGKYFYVHDGNRLVEGSPRPITDYGIPEAITQIDAAFFWPKNERVYLFRRNLYWRRNDFTNIIDGNYPRSIDRWNGLPRDLDAAVTDDKGYSYFFKGENVWMYDNANIRPTKDSPRGSVRSWTGC